jgi:NifU-like protein
MWDYSEKVKEHFFHPRNAKLVEGANAKGDVGSISCGDALSLTLKVNRDNEVIEDAGFQTFGCGSAIASSSALTEMIIGKTLSQALEVTNQDIADYLDGLPPEKMHCSVMGMEALHAAVADYRGETARASHEEGELICKCFAIDDQMIRRVVLANHLTTLEEIIHYTNAGGSCTSCHEKIEWVLEACLAEMAQNQAENEAHKASITKASITVADDVSVKPELTETDHIWQTIEQAIDNVRPGVIADGGNIRLVDIEDNMVFVAMAGSCLGCGLSGLTMANLEHKISQALGRAYVVFPVQESESAPSHKKEGTFNV